MKVCVTGGLGYIGSHVVIELLKAGHEVVVVDNLVNSSSDSHDEIVDVTNTVFPAYIFDVCDSDKMYAALTNNSCEAVIHLAGYKHVQESVADPLSYYTNNLNSTSSILRAMTKAHCHRIIFSSSATVYGNYHRAVTEADELKSRKNPYAETKAMCEKIIEDCCRAFNIQGIALRYFNPIGRHESGIIKRHDKIAQQDLMSGIKRSVSLGKPLKLYGDDYPTPDGTAIRDYIHVTDLAKAHVTMLEHLYISDTDWDVYNVGTGKQHTVKEIVQQCEIELKKDIPYVITKRRDGDIAYSCADISKIESVGWKPEYNLGEMIASEMKEFMNEE